MNLYPRQHRFYCGVDPHARSMFVCTRTRPGISRRMRSLRPARRPAGTPFPEAERPTETAARRWTPASEGNIFSAFDQPLRRAPPERVGEAARRGSDRVGRAAAGAGPPGDGAIRMKLADDALCDLGSLRLEDMRTVRVADVGPALECGYELFTRVFPRAVMDPLDVYKDGLQNWAPTCRELIPCFAAACFDVDGDEILAGFLSANVMVIEHRTRSAVLALGNMATSPRLKAAGLKGVGSALLGFAIQVAREETRRDGVALAYAVAEAEPDSLGFWRKMGFLWPRGCQYLQPPLEFLADGSPLCAEVPETLLLAPIDGPRDRIGSGQLLAIIRAIYEHWSLGYWRSRLAPAAMRRAEDYVMTTVLGRVQATLPSGELALVDSLPRAERKGA